ncbi:hypothetical protein MP228_002876 [Amoeboaphelidium protococcarum]|nr:hypothetical protein MP228_002876 [Amoeboaphelidium protococcarum]
MRIILIRWLILSLLLCMAVYADSAFKKLGDQLRAFKQPGNHADFKDARLAGKGVALNTQVFSQQSANGVGDDVLADPSVGKRFWAGMHRGSKQQKLEQQQQQYDVPGEDPPIKQRARVWGTNLHVPFSSKKADSPYLPQVAQNKIKPFLDKYRRPVKKHTSAVYGINGDANVQVKDTADFGLQVDDSGPSYPSSFTGHSHQPSLSSVDLNSYADQGFDADDDDVVQNRRPKFGARIINKLKNIGLPKRLRQKAPQYYHKLFEDLMQVERSLQTVQQESDLLLTNDVFDDVNGNKDASQLTHFNTGNADQHNDQLRSGKARVWGTDIRLPWKKKASGSYFAGPGRVQKYFDSRFQKGYDIIKSNSRQIPNEHDDSSSTPLLRRV